MYANGEVRRGHTWNKTKNSEENRLEIGWVCSGTIIIVNVVEKLYGVRFCIDVDGKCCLVVVALAHERAADSPSWDLSNDMIRKPTLFSGIPPSAHFVMHKTVNTKLLCQFPNNRKRRSPHAVRPPVTSPATRRPQQLIDWIVLVGVVEVVLPTEYQLSEFSTKGVYLMRM